MLSLRKLVLRALVLVAVSLALPLACGGPRYPNCEKDDQCNDETHKGVCVRGMCAQCRDDSGCDKGKVCKDGACSLPEGFCDGAHACASGSCGGDHKCHEAPAASLPPVECDDDHLCTGSAHCENGRSVTRMTPQRNGSLKSARVILTGHCDARGENEFNMSLGAQRAETVKGILISLGVPAARVSTSSRGKLDAVGTDDASMAADRRVDIEVR